MQILIKLNLIFVLVATSFDAYAQAFNPKKIGEFEIGRSDSNDFHGKFRLNNIGNSFFTIDKKHRLMIRNLDSGDVVWTIPGKVLQAEFSPSGLWIAVVFRDKNRVLGIFDLSKGRLQTLEFPNKVSIQEWSPAEDVLALSDSRFRLHFVDARSLKQVSTEPFVKRRKTRIGRFFPHVGLQQ